jgi:ABC-type multidrug transport system fused ATPase/permease subunit
VNALAGFFSSFAVQLLGNLLLLLGILAAVYLIDIQLGWAFTGFVALTLALLTWVWRRGAPYWRADREQSAGFYGFVGEVLTATEDIRSSGAVGYVLQRFFAHLRGWLPVAQRAGLWSQAVMMAAIVAFAVGEAISYGLGGSLYRAGVVSLGDVYMLLAYMAMLAAPIETVRTQLQDLQHADAGISRINELLAVRSRLADGKAALPEGALAVDLRSVRFRYEAVPDSMNSLVVEQGILTQPVTSLGNGVHAATSLPFSNKNPLPLFWTLDDITFHLPPGHILGVLGRTGSGKTTLARLLFRMVDPQQGEVRLGGVDLHRARLESVRSQVGLVTQEVQLFAASLRDNLTFFEDAASDEALLALLGELGLQPWLARLPQGLDTPITPATLSAGEAQLIALGRVFLKDPGLVILDEASSRLDPATEVLLDGALDRLLAGRPTAIIIAHRLSTLERADEILILEQGQVLEYGPRLQLVADPMSRYSELRRIGLQEVLV